MSALLERLERARRELLDLSTRNRLLAAPVNSTSARVVQVHDEVAAEVFRLLVRERKRFRFLPGRKQAATGSPFLAPQVGDAAAGEEAETALPPSEETGEEAASGLAKRHLDSRLQTALTPEGLQRRLLDLYRDARTSLEETGVNVLYLALGQLQWFEADHPDTPRFAPLVLVPVELQRQSAATRFELTACEEDVEENLSLRAKLEADFDLKLPEFPDPDDLDLNRYLADIAAVISGQEPWTVLPNAILLGFFSFAKFLMYRDLDPESWPADRPLLRHPFVSSLLGEGFPAADPPIREDAHLDELIPVERLDHVVDADGSQTCAIETVRQGRSLVIQGPPGTGKSQSITNLIATAVLEGRKVLFVAEKLAALDVVKRRLEREGLGELCLELHSHKASKRAVLEDLRKTWQLGKPRAEEAERLCKDLATRRARLNDHARGLHTPHPATGLTPFRVMGELIRLGSPLGPVLASPAGGPSPAPAAACPELVGAEAWDHAARQQREQLVLDLAERLQQIGLPAEHPWRGVQRETVLPMDLPPLLAAMSRASEALATVQPTGATLAAALRVAEPTNLTDACRLVVLARHAASAPAVDRQALCASVWSAGLDGLGRLICAGETLAAAMAEAGAQVSEAAWEQDFEPVRRSVAAHGRSWLRIFNGEYRRAVATVRGVLQATLPGGLEARLALLDVLVRGQQALRAIRAGDEVGRSAFGEHWRAGHSDWAHLRRIHGWVGQHQAAGLGGEFRRLFVAVEDVPAAGALGERLDAETESARNAAQDVFTALSLDVPSAFGVPAIEDIAFPELAARLDRWRETPESLSRWSNFFLQARQARDLGLGVLVDGLNTGAIAAEAATPTFHRACYSRILREMTRLNPDLARFDGELHGRVVREFQRLDRERLRLAKYRVLTAHHAGLPNFNAGVGAVGIVKSELERKRGHRPVRKLLADAGSVVQAIKPVFMMSPLSVAQFLTPGAVGFDLLIVDEASQVQPVDALGAVARCEQLVVVGDSQQLPPTRFFARLTSDAPEVGSAEDRDAAQVQDLESILGLCCARGLPQTMLRWHYRSRHHSLIAVSNHAFYADQLVIVPSPYDTTTELGLQFHHLPEGVFDSGGSGANRVEARAISRAVIEHARHHPELTLGVAAFSVRQQQALLDELELLRRENPETEPFFQGHPHEPFFVKNLENVQGDERDVILISIGYGRDLNGFLAMRFGPLANEGGERRLNVLISRARRRCEVFASITADDIDPERAQGRGVRALKQFLEFAQTGRLRVAAAADQESASPFEEAVRAALEAAGHEVQPHVGIAGFFVDLAVRDREQPGRFLLGIECDGPAYAATRSARDRDRLRPAVLEDHGWILHRVWSADWFQRPAEQLERTLRALERARATLEQSRTRTPRRPRAPNEIAREEPVGSGVPLPGLEAEPYRVAKFSPPHAREPQELSTGEMAALILRIVREEGPVHEEEILARVKELWGLQRAGPRLQDAVAKGLRALLVGRQCTREDDCLTIPEAPVPIRRRDVVPSPGLRKPERLPPAEIRAAILALIEAAHGVRREELPTAIARLFGFATTTATLRERIERQVARLEGQHVVSEANGLLQRG